MPQGKGGNPSSIPISEWLYLHTGLVWATQREIEADFLDADYPATNQVIAWLVKSGKVTVKTAGRSVTAKKGCWIFPGSGKGRQKIEPGSVFLSLRFFAEWPAGKPLFDHRETLVFPAATDRALTRAAGALESLVRRVSQRDGFFFLNQGTADMESYFSIRRAFENWMLAYARMMLRLGRQPSTVTFSDRRVLRAARILDNRPLRHPLRESDLSKEVGLSVTHLNRLFHRDLGISPKKYLERRRLQAARLLLQRHRRSVKETAYELGFNSLPHFSAWFRRKQGLSPRVFQNRR